jgi:hypothetical protein
VLIEVLQAVSFPRLRAQPGEVAGERVERQLGEPVRVQSRVPVIPQLDQPLAPAADPQPEVEEVLVHVRMKRFDPGDKDD